MRKVILAILLITVISSVTTTVLAEPTLKFSKMSLDAGDSATEITALESGIITCTAAVPNNTEGCLIVVLKKNGYIEKMSFVTQKINEASTDITTGLYVPEGEGYYLEVFLWNDIKGSGSLAKKYVLDDKGGAFVQ